MSRKGQSLLLLALVVMMLAGCDRIGGLLGRRPTPAPTAIAVASPSTTAVPTAAATSTVATAVPLVTLTATPTAIPPTAVATNTAAPPTATRVPPAATAVPPTAIPNQGPPPGGQARITFAPGATSAVVQSTLAARGDTDNWVVRVSAGQIITVQTIASPPGAINVQLLDANGGLLAGNPDTTAVSATARATGDYQIVFSTPNAAPQVSYTAQVLIPPGSVPINPTRIQFAPGASVAQLNDSLVAGGDLNQYVLRLAANQQLSVAVFASVPAVTNINIRNSAGQQIASGTDMSGVLATTTAAGDYFIDVSSAATAPAVNYLLTVSAPPPPTNEPQRIEFGPGQSGVMVNGLVRAGVGARYLVEMAAGQVLVISLTGRPVNTIDVAVSDASGAVLNVSRDPFQGLNTTITAGGDATIQLSTTSATDVTYVMTVVVPPPPGAPTRINFAPGATSATVEGSLAFGGDVAGWVFRGAAGQPLNLGIGTHPSGWLNLFVYDPAGQMIAAGTDLTGVALPLPADGDYTVVLSTIQAAPPVDYALTVNLPPVTPPEPVRIAFGPGQTSAEYVVALSPWPPARFVIALSGGQTLLTRLNDDPPASMDITITDAAGNVLNFGRGPTELGTLVPATGDYIINLSTAAATSSASLIITVPPLPGNNPTRIIFDAGASSAVVAGDLAFGGDVDTWLLAASAGGTLSVTVSSNQPGWSMIYIYDQFGSIIGLGSDMTTVGAPLTFGGEYRIVVVSDAAAGPIGYTMTTTVE